MSEPVELQVFGTPAPQGSKSAYIRGGRAIVVEGTSKTGRASHAAWRQAVATAARDYLEAHPGASFSEPVAVTITFRFAIVASDKYRLRHTTKPDIDKLVRTCFDALKDGGLLADDSQVWSVLARKRYALITESPGATIYVDPCGRAEQESRESRKQAAKLARSRV